MSRPAERPDGRRIALVVGDRLQRIASGRAGPHQHVSPLAGRHEQRLVARHIRDADAVIGDNMQGMPAELEIEVVLVSRMDDPPALHLAGPHSGSSVRVVR